MRAGTLEYLSSLGGPVIRARTARELAPASPQEIAHLQTDLIDTAQVKRWLERLMPRTGLHGSKPECFENALGKLVMLGLRVGCSELDQRTAPFRAWLAAQDEDLLTDPFCRSLAASFLLMAGYTDQAVLAEVRRRLDRISAFVRPGWRELYIDPAPYTDIPQAFRRHRLVDPAFYPQGDSHYPLIYDLHAFAALWPGASQSEREQINAVAAYILLPDYQQIEPGYGIMRAGPRRYYSIGWDCLLPGYGALNPTDLNGSFIQRLVLMSTFPAARAHPWFHNALAHLQQFATSRGTWIFPRAYLPEKSAGYWVGGAYMGLEENRRAERAIELESTFWIAKILLS
jgi:hypothetical protein